MKKLLLLIGLLALPLVACAQTTTNIDWRIRTIVLSAGTPQSTNTSNFLYDYTVKKDALKTDGYVFYFNAYQRNGGTNTFDVWLKTDVGDRAKSYQDAKQVNDMQATLTKVRDVSLLYPDLLTQADINALNTIAAKAP